MSFATDKWFRHLREELLTEGLGDIGLSEDNVTRIRMELPDASEKGRVWVGNALKEYGLRGFRRRSRVFEEYKDIEEAYKVHFQKGDFNILTQYADTISGQPIKKWPKAKKSFIKNSRKLGVSDAIINTVTLFIDEIGGKVFSDFMGKIENVAITLNQNPNNYEMIKDFPPSDWDEAEKECYEFQQNQEDPDQILHTFEDGSYWYDLQSSQCSTEGDRMGHCGDDYRGTLYSLRKKDKGKKLSKSYVTITYNEHEETIFQIKGRNNDAPPESVWKHITWFIDNHAVETVEETGEHSNDEEGISEMIDWLKSESPGVSFSNSYEDRWREFTDECEEYRRRFDDEQVSMDGLHVEDYDAEYFSWSDSFQALSVKITSGVVLDEDVLGWENMPEELSDMILEILQDEDSADLLEDYSADELFLTRANSYLDSFAKARNFHETTVTGKVKRGTGTYLVLMELDSTIPDSMPDLNHNVPADYGEYLDSIERLVSDAEDAIDGIQDALIEAGVLAKPKVKSYIEKVQEEFNNFQVNTTSAGRGEYDIIATGIAIKTTQDEMDTLLGPVSFVKTFTAKDGYKTSSGYYTSPLFKASVIAELSDKRKEAVDFAKRQMKLNYGEQYEEKIENLWDKMGPNLHNKLFFDAMFAGFKIQTPHPSRGREPRPGEKTDTKNNFSYKMQVILNENTLPFYGPFLEYYDNNFQIVVDAFDKAIRKEIVKAVDKFKETTGNDTNLPLQEVESTLDVRIYEVDFVMSYPLGQGFEITDIHNIIRAIPDVTTIRSIGNAKRTQGNRTVSLQHLKFALQGQKNRMEWVRQVLLPQIRKIDSRIRIHKVERAQMISTSKSLRENWGGSSQRPTQAMRTPRATVQQTLADWVEGGVMYDMPMHTNLSSYHVMVPVEELEPFMNREPRKHGHHFDAGYENFIANGPIQPIYLAIGKNGRAKITGNEDDLRYALKAGVKEVPVFFSYQRQV